jgi:hypothetical protein
MAEPFKALLNKGDNITQHLTQANKILHISGSSVKICDLQKLVVADL